MQHLHVTFQDELQETQKSFHDNVNSAECTCNFGKLFYKSKNELFLCENYSGIRTRNVKTNSFIILLDPSDTPLIQHPTNCIKLFAEAEPTPGLPDLNYEVCFVINAHF